MTIYQVTDNSLVEIQTTTFASKGIKERNDLQRLLRDQIDIVSPDTLIIAEEFSDWEDSRRRVDLLGIDKRANLVVIELKRTEDGGHMELQAVRYAAMVSTLTFNKAVEIYEKYLDKMGTDQDAESSILEFLEWEEPSDDELIFANGKTYAFHKMWGRRTVEALEILVNRFNDQQISFKESD